MSRIKFILSTLRYHARMDLAVALGVMAATAVLTGALLVGDSVRGSLRDLTLDRLGRIDAALVTDRFFRTQLADELSAAPGFKAHFASAVPAILVQGTVENPKAVGGDLAPSSPHHARAGRVTVVGCDQRFWTLGQNGPKKLPQPGEVVINDTLAEQIHAKAGDEVLLRLGQVNEIPADSPLGRKTETIRNVRLSVSEVIPAKGLGRFGLSPNQQLPFDAFVDLSTLQKPLKQPHKANAIFVAGEDPAAAPSPQAEAALQAALHPSLADYGFSLKGAERGYVQFTSSRMLLDAAAVQAVEKSFADHQRQPSLTYLANTIAARGKQIPYSTITAIDFTSTPPLGPFNTTDGQPIEPLTDREIVLNAWAAEDLGAAVGDRVEVSFFEPESTHGRVRERTEEFKLKAIAAIEGAAADRELTPELPGVTDQLSMGDWDPPFPFEPTRVRKKDEQYWDDYRGTPKAFVSLATGRRLWHSRFGQTTAIRIAPQAGETAAKLARRLELEPSQLGFQFLNVKSQGLAAATGTTPFSLLFLGFSFFIMAAAVMLVALLFRLNLETRANELGILAAVGFGRRAIRRLLIAEGLGITIIGGLLGTLAGLGYAWLMLAGLRSWWLDAITTPFLDLHVTAESLAIGFASGVVVSLLTIFFTLRRMGRASVRRLLSGEATAQISGFARPSKWPGRVGWTLGAAAVAIGFGALGLGGEAQAGAFVASGALVLAAMLLAAWGGLRRRGASSSTAQSVPFLRLAVRNGSRNPSRSTLTIGLVAAASFLIVAISAFRLDPASQGRGKQSGSGGYSLIAESDQPIYQDLNSDTARQELGFSKSQGKLLARCTTVELRVQPGDDASCLNLYAPRQPRVLGVTPAFVNRGGFAWAASAAASDAERENPWILLNEPLEDADAVPVVLDMNTAMYSLHLWKGVGERFEIQDGRGKTVRLQIVGLLKNSILQGDVLLGEQAFLRHFPDVSGYRMFLIDTSRDAAGVVPDDQLAEQAGAALEDALGDYGLDAEPTVKRLASLLAVQNTYLSTFQTLGGLGLLLGTFGLATVQLRNVLERRGELALMRAAGFRRGQLARLVLIENALLLLAGLGSGVAAALVAVLPHMFGGGASVPWATLLLTLSTVLAVGFLAGLFAVRATLRAELLPALRGD